MDLNNITYSHEHVVIDLSKGKNDEDCYLNMFDDALDELKELYTKGVRRIVDCSNYGIGVNHDVNRKLEKATGIEIIDSTGYYKDPFFDKDFEIMNEKELCNLFVDDILNHGCQIIGEIGTSNNLWTDNEKKLFNAAIKAHKKTNCIIITHTTLGTLQEEQVEYFNKHNVNLKKVIISHVALNNDLEKIKTILNKGVNVAFDTIGKNNYLSDETRVKWIKELIDEGYKKQLLMSMDITRKSHLKKNGGKGYSYLIDRFVPMLIDGGVKQKDIQTIMCENFEDILRGK